MKDTGFELRKFQTNDQNLQIATKKIEKFQPLEDNLKVLGIDWDKLNDSFIIDLNKIMKQVSNYPRQKETYSKL